ncbi:MAG TPA: DivIVA domain-containing protein [Ignavibacteria bacterium]|nr:DivIVA domain-containing protein [Ignavibacteria bacterium]
MNLTSKEIKKNDFKKTFRGYDINEVDAFLETVSNHYDKLLIENKNLSDKIKSLTSDINIYKENELTLQKAIVKSQDLADEIIANAKKKAEIIVREGELNNVKLSQDVSEDIINKRNELEEIKLKNERLIEETKNFLIDKLTEFEDFIKNKRIFKMELTNHKSGQQEYEKELEDKIKSAINILPGSSAKSHSSGLNEIQGSSFDDTFEAK